MPTSSYMPNVVVEIAWGSGYATPAASRSWTDVSAYVELGEGITISGGRQNERSTADANQCSLTLDNSDGRFTAGLASSPYYPNVKLDVPIRVRADPVDGADSTRFVGYVNEWPVEWNGTGAYASASITAPSRISRLGYTAALNNIIATAILDNDPVAYYMLGEPTDSTQANDSSGLTASPLTLTGDAALPVVFGNAVGPGTDGLTAAEFASGQYLHGSDDYLTTGGMTLLCFYSSTSTPTDYTPILSATGPGGGFFMEIGGGSSGFLGAGVGGSPALAGTVSEAVNYSDGQTHCFAVVHNGTQTLSLYADGVLVDTTTNVNNVQPWSALTDLSVGGYTDFLLVGVMQHPQFTGVLAHAAVFNTALAAPQILAISDAGLTGYAGETVDDRLERYASYANILPAEISAEASTILVQHVDTTDKQVVDLMRVMETTEGGVLYDERDGTLTFHNRAHRYNAASAFTLDMNEQEVEAGYQPLLDRTYILNDVSVADVSGTYSARKTDPTSLSDYGPMTATVETADIDDDAPLNMASWTVLVYKDPRVRVASCGVNVLAQVGKSPNSATVLAATVGTKITVSNHPAQAAASSATYFVEGWTEVYGPESLQVTWNLSPTSPWDQTLIIGNASGRGVIGTNPVAF